MANRKKMDQAERAKQFMPFSALKGFRELLREKERIVVEKPELSEDFREVLDRRLSMLQVQDMVSVICFQDGAYVRVTGMVSRIDRTAGVLKIVNTKIRLKDICDLQGERFGEMEWNL